MSDIEVIGAAAQDSGPLVRLEGLRVSFGRSVDDRRVVDGVSFELHRGRCLAIVGESGSGKSVTARTLVGLTGRRASLAVDRFEFAGRDVSRHGDRDWRKIRGRDIGFVSQDALVSLDQLRPVGKEIDEAARVHRVGGTKAERHARVVELLDQVGVPDPELKARQLPHELSGGQRQRALIASALALDPQLIIADEPTTALDVTVQAQVLELLEAARDRGKALIIISHDLAVVSRMADEVLVMRDGEVVERGVADEVFRNPQHEYTQRLLDAVPSAHSRGARLSPGEPSRISAVRAVPDPAVAPADPSVPLLEATGLVKSFRGPDRVVRTVVQDVSFALGVGETLGVVGESGSGKSTTARIALALETPDRGEVLLGGQPWSALSEKERRPRRNEISVIYQDPLSSFDPRWPVERIVEDSIGADVQGAAARRARVEELLDQVGLPRAFRRRRPLELSGGQRQRVAIARAIAPRPRVIVCDEPVSALDVSIQAQVLDLLGDLRDELGVSYLFISHDLGVVHHISDRVLVMSEGLAVEHGEADDVLLRPRHEYTKRLVAAVPRLRHEPVREARVA
ncbi:ABC transporter ATP-binding protein [Patulibacter sp. NPDC049589]|uniref:ABC transporter ATP-binding protein n=1 Tax=Patulibacter sp. NPDC049589 TaxID=3154731 RepID=UPI0034205EA3